MDRLLIGAAFLILTAAIGWIISQSRRAFSFVDTVSVSGNSLVLPEEVEYETGRLLIEGRSYYLGKGRHYQIERRFVNSSSGRGSEIVPIWDEFFVEINGDGIGYFNAPAVLIKTGKYSGLALIFLTSRSETRFRDTMHLEVNGEGRRLNITLMEVSSGVLFIPGSRRRGGLSSTSLVEEVKLRRSSEGAGSLSSVTDSS